jgi:hypothetical protein
MLFEYSERCKRGWKAISRWRTVSKEMTGESSSRFYPKVFSTLVMICQLKLFASVVGKATRFWLEANMQY